MLNLSDCCIRNLGTPFQLLYYIINAALCNIQTLLLKTGHPGQKCVHQGVGFESVRDQSSSRAYEWVTGVLGLIITGTAIIGQGLGDNWHMVVCWALSYLVFSDKTVFMTPDAAFMPGYPIVVATLSTVGLTGNAWLIIVSFIYHAIRNCGRISRIAFNMGTIAIASLAANSIMTTIWGTTQLLKPLSLEGLFRGLVMVFSYSVVLTFFHSMFAYFENPNIRFTRRLTISFKRCFRWFMPSYYVFSVLLIHLAQTGGVVGSLLFLFAIYALWGRFYFSRAYQQESIRSGTDALTGAFNRRGFRRYLSTELKLSKLPVSVLFIDIDDFKSLNDEFGHDFGDEVLCTITRLLRKYIRGDDLVVRWGGEEFIIFLWNTHTEHAFDIAERICSAIRDCELSFGAKVTVSIGCSGTNDIGEVSKLIFAADSALYRAKEAGKDCVYEAPLMQSK